VSIDPQQASAMLADVDSVVSRVKQSRIYRRSGDILILWGVLHLARFVLFRLAPLFASTGWIWLDLIGVAATIWILRGHKGFGRRFPWRLVGVYALFYGFGWLWADVIGAMGPRQLTAFWPTLFQFGFAIAGLWFGWAFFVIGIGAAAATVAAFLWSGASYGLAITLISASSMIGAGLWMRRA
jgi:hypothetical protein